MNTSSMESLEQQALEERNHLHERVNELKGKIAITRDHLNLAKTANEHFAGMAIVTGVLGFVSGYALADLFVRH